jgi:hypothetical protein
LFKGYGAKICRLTTYVKAENSMVTVYFFIVSSLHNDEHLSFVGLMVTHSGYFRFFFLQCGSF